MTWSEFFLLAAMACNLGAALWMRIAIRRTQRLNATLFLIVMMAWTMRGWHLDLSDFWCSEDDRRHNVNMATAKESMMSESNRRDELIDEMHRSMDSARDSVLSGDPDDVFAAGSQVGLTIGIGLAVAHCIQEQSLRDKHLAEGEFAMAAVHDFRAQAFEEIANALRQWNTNHPMSPKESPR